MRSLPQISNIQLGGDGFAVKDVSGGVALDATLGARGRLRPAWSVGRSRWRSKVRMRVRAGVGGGVFVYVSLNMQRKRKQKRNIGIEMNRWWRAI